MVRAEPMSDLVVYAVVFGVVALMMVGKLLMFKDDKIEETIIETKENNDKSKDN